MRDEPLDLPQDVLIRAMRDSWGLEPVGLTYAPVGFGSYHWEVLTTGGARRFITADRLTASDLTREAAFENLRSAYSTAAYLHDAGLEAAVAPERTKDGQYLAHLGTDWALAVFPYVSGKPAGNGSWSDAETERLQAAALIGTIHSMPAPNALRRWDPAIPFRTALHDALRALDESWTSGPHGEPTRLLLYQSRPRIEAQFLYYDHLAKEVMAIGAPWVISHGEPHSGNFISGEDGRLHLVDWDTVLLAPRERDLETLIEVDGEALAAYQSVVGAIDPNLKAVELFRLRWALAEICSYVHRFRAEHGDSADDRLSWENLTQYIRVIEA
jgi:spectinomycin phosphotransferase